MISYNIKLPDGFNQCTWLICVFPSFIRSIQRNIRMVICEEGKGPDPNFIKICPKKPPWMVKNQLISSECNKILQPRTVDCILYMSSVSLCLEDKLIKLLLDVWYCYWQDQLHDLFALSFKGQSKIYIFTPAAFHLNILLQNQNTVVGFH